MSEHSSPVQDPNAVPFSPAELKQFDADDAQAGRAIGKLLSLFFLYTVIAMTIVVFATYWWVTQRPAN